MKTCHGLRARQTSRSNSSGVRLIGYAVAGHGVSGDVDGQRADGEGVRAGGVVTAYPGPDPRDQLLGLERLHDVVVGPGLQADHDVDGVALRGEHHDRHAGLGADLLAHVDATLAGQHQVEQDDVGAVGVERLQRLVAALHEVGVEALLAQHDRQHLRQGRVVVDDEHARAEVLALGHGCNLASRDTEIAPYGVGAGPVSSGTGPTCRDPARPPRGTTPGRRSAR